MFGTYMLSTLFIQFTSSIIGPLDPFTVSAAAMVPPHVGVANTVWALLACEGDNRESACIAGDPRHA